MKKTFCFLLTAFFASGFTFSVQAQSNYVLNPLTTFGSGDGSIQPPSSSPPVDAGFNQRGIAYDPISGNVVYVDTHSGSGGSAAINPSAGIYILDGATGAVITTLNTNGISGGSYTHVGAAVANDGVVYVCNQVTVSSNAAFKIYRWDSVNSVDPPVIAFSDTILPTQRYGESIDIRGSGAGTEIIIGSMPGTTATNVVIFTTADGTNFAANVIGCTNVLSANFNDGIAFGVGNTFWAKRIGAPLLYLSYDLAAKTAAAISRFDPSNMPGVQNLGAISVDNVNHLLAAMEQVGGTVNSGPERIWLFDITDTAKPPVALSYRDYTPNNPNATAPHGYLDFGGGRLYANNVNNGILASAVELAATPLPVILKNLSPTNRVAVGQTARFEVQAYPNITGYQWRTNGVAIPGATNFFLDVPNVQTTDSGRTYSVVISNPAGSTNSANSVLSVVNPADLFHLSLLWSFAPGQTNYISTAGANTPNERSMAYNALSNEIYVVYRNANNIRVFVVDAHTGEYLRALNTNGIVLNGAATPINIPLLAVGVGADGAIYACNQCNAVDAQLQQFKIYRWADSSTNSYPTNIWSGNPAPQVTTAAFRWGDAMDVRGAGANTQIILDNQDTATFRFVSVIRPSGSDLNQPWTAKGFVLQNNQGGVTIGRSIQFGLGDTFWQKRWLAAGAPLVHSGFGINDPDPSVAPIILSSTGLPLFTNGLCAINFTFSLGAALSFSGPPATPAAIPDELVLYDLANPSTPVMLNRYNFPINRAGNANAIGQVAFGTNAALGTNYVFALNGNNGIMAFTLSSGPVPPPVILTQPRNQRVIVGNSFALSIVLDSRADVQWQKDSGSGFVDIVGATNTTYSVASAQLSDTATYRTIAGNSAGSVASSNATVSVTLLQDNYTLTQIWSTNAGYVSIDGGPNTPKERAIGFNALSNQLLVVRCPVQGNPSTAVPEVHVVDPDTGTELYTLNTTGIFGSTESEVAGSNPLNLCAIAVAEDGNIYACNEVPNGSGGAVLYSDSKLFRVYRWTNSHPDTVPVQIFSGDPASQTGQNLRWGDVMTVRGSGTNTEILFDDQAIGAFAGILKPSDGSLNTFTNLPLTIPTGGGTIGRSIQFQSGTNFWQKRKGTALFLTGYNPTTNTGVQVAKYDNFPTTLGGVAVDGPRSLAIGVDFVGNATTTPDAVALYDIADPNTPMLISRHNFPMIPQVGNVNWICSTVISGNRVFSLDGNNGIVAFTINPPATVNRPTLTITHVGSDVLISWSTNHPGLTLQSSPGISPTSWSNAGSPGIVGPNYVVTNSIGGGLFYRLIQ
jgi:hypothetical protein